MADLGYKVSYADEYLNMFSTRNYLRKLKESAKKGGLQNTRMRSICWKLFLGCLPENKQDWVAITKVQRGQYDEILDKSLWDQDFQNHELKKTIQQDVRKVSEIRCFKATEMQDMMINILFNYAHEFPHIAYKQGMHELLAPILYVLYLDQKSYLCASRASTLNSEIQILMDENYLEHDAFTLFCVVIGRIEAWWIDPMDTPCSKRETSEFTENPYRFLSLPDALKCISTRLLARIDEELFIHLKRLKIYPQMYGIPWLRYLFGKQFPGNQLLILWDAIFADSIDFLLVDYIFVAILNSIRGLLLEGDYATCLNLLTQFPHAADDVKHIIYLALRLKDPDKCKVVEGGPRIQEISTKLTVIKSFPKTSSRSVMTPTISRESLEIRPKSLSIAELFPPGSLSEKPKTKPFGESEPDPSLDYLSETASGLSIGGYSSIRHTMERSHRFQATDVSQMIGPESARSLISKKASREMVPSVSGAASNIFKEFQNLPKDIAQENQALKKNNNHCVNLMNYHLNMIKEWMVGQKLKKEYILISSLAGLEQVKNILNGTANLPDEVMENVKPLSKPKRSSDAPLSKQDLLSKTSIGSSVASGATYVVTKLPEREEEKDPDSFGSLELLDMRQNEISFPTKKIF